MDSFTAIADPTRRQMIELLRRGALPSTRVAEELKLKPQTASMHLKTLERAGVVMVSRAGTKRIYSFNADALEPATRWLLALA